MRAEWRHRRLLHCQARHLPRNSVGRPGVRPPGLGQEGGIGHAGPHRRAHFCGCPPLSPRLCPSDVTEAARLPDPWLPAPTQDPSSLRKHVKAHSAKEQQVRKKVRGPWAPGPSPQKTTPPSLPSLPSSIKAGNDHTHCLHPAFHTQGCYCPHPVCLPPAQVSRWSMTYSDLFSQVQ